MGEQGYGTANAVSSHPVRLTSPEGGQSNRIDHFKVQLCCLGNKVAQPCMELINHIAIKLQIMLLLDALPGRFLDTRVIRILGRFPSQQARDLTHTKDQGVIRVKLHSFLFPWSLPKSQLLSTKLSVQLVSLQPAKQLILIWGRKA